MQHIFYYITFDSTAGNASFYLLIFPFNGKIFNIVNLYIFVFNCCKHTFSWQTNICKNVNPSGFG